MSGVTLALALKIGEAFFKFLAFAADVACEPLTNGSPIC